MIDIYGGKLSDPDQFTAEPAKVPRDFTLTASQLLTSQAVTVRGHHAYFVVLRLMATFTGAFRTQIRTSETYGYHSNGLAGGNDRVRNECMWGTAARPHVLAVAMIVPANSALLLDLEDISVAGNTLHLVFDGIKLYRK